MNAPNHNGYLLLSRSDEWHKELSLAELQNIVAQNKAWHEQLATQGKIKGGLALGREGVMISGHNRRIVSDGPFAEAKEVIGGTLVLDVATMEEAIAIAKTLPSLAYSTTIEVRPVDDECPLTAYARARAQEEQREPANI